VIEAEFEQQGSQGVLLLRRQPAEGAAHRPPIAVADDLAGEHGEPQRFPAKFEPDSPRKLRIDVPLKAQLASAFREVDQMSLRADQSLTRIDKQECAATEPNSSVPPPV
jgi:hypothetical protein